MASKNTKNSDAITVSTSIIAKMFDITDRRVRQLVDEGVIDKIKNGSFELVSTVRKYILHLKTKNDYKSDDKTPETLKILEQVKHEATKREISEIKLKLMKGQVHNSYDVERTMTDMLMAFKTKIRSSPIKIASQIRGNMNMAEITDIVSNELDNALLELSEYDPAKFYSNLYSDADEEEEDEDEDDLDEESQEEND